MAEWKIESNRELGIKTILFLISPFISFLYCLKSIKTKSSYVIFFLASVFFGMSFTADIGRTNDLGLDSASYREEFEIYKSTSPFEYYDGLLHFISFDDGKKDYYFDTVAFYVSRFTDNYHVMFMIFAIIFSFLLLKTLAFLTKEDKFDNSIACLIIVFLFTINGIFNINGMRMWTAAWIGVYSIFQIFRNGNLRYFLLLLTTPFFHGSYWFFIGMITLIYFLKRFDKVWSILFIISFFVSNISVELVRNSSDYLPIFLQRVITFYTDQDYIGHRNSSGIGFYWVSVLFNTLTSIFINLVTFLFIKNSINIKHNIKTKNLYLFLIPYMTIVNFTMAIPSLGGRYIILAYPIIAYIWLVSFYKVKYKKILYSVPFIYSFSFLWFSLIKYYGSVLEPLFYISSPFYLIYKYLII